MSKWDKISNRTRERAALICAVSASAGPHGLPYDRIIKDLDLRDEPASDLALHAWFQAMRGKRLSEWTRAIDAEAEALLRTGWSP